MRRQYSPHEIAASVAFLRPVEMRQHVSPLDASRELLKQVLGDSEWTGFKEAAIASEMLRSVLGVSWKPQTLHRYRALYGWPRGVMWLQAPGKRGTVTYSVLEITAWYLSQQENS